MSATLVLPPPAATTAVQTPDAVFAGQLRDGWTFAVFDRLSAIDPVLWGRLFAPHWKNYAYYQTLEETFPAEFPQRYLVLSHAGAVRAVLPLFFATQDLTVSLPARVRALLRPLRRQLTMRMLMAGCIVGSAQLGLANPTDLPAVSPWLDEALGAYARQEGVSILLYKDFPREYRAGLSGPLAARGCMRMASLPGVGLDLNFASFDDYLQTHLGKATRKSLRRKFREVETLAEPITLEVKESITEREATELHALYERVARRGDVQFEVFTRDYFLKLGQRMPEHTRYFVWRHAGRVVAFSFCMVHNGVIYDNDIGLDEAASPALHLYHVTFRDIIRWALAHGLRRYESAPFSYHPKLHLRQELVPLDLYARHTSPLVNRLLHLFAPLAAPTRQEPLLRQFPNFAEL